MTSSALNLEGASDAMPDLVVGRELAGRGRLERVMAVRGEQLPPLEMIEAVHTLLVELGEDPQREGLRDPPGGLRACCERSPADTMWTWTRSSTVRFSMRTTMSP